MPSATPTSAPLATASPDLTDRAYWNGTIKMSLSKLFILRSLIEAPAHGYEIARRVAEMTRGCCSPTEGTVYPVMREFEAGGYVTRTDETVGGRPRKIYTLTQRGRTALEIALGAWAEATAALTLASRDILAAPERPAHSAGAGCCTATPTPRPDTGAA
ncbi:PadR family transcriptional regulator [Pannonibacter tanglangensis]|nr:PadR family transcriptional regulator [Pannonibacter sp. XCT-53]